jgi:RecA/RadA recombinase
MTTYINIFGGPGSGKSTSAARLFAAMKMKRMNVELVTEVAKDFVWEERDKTLSIQPYITIKQFRNLIRLDGKVDYVITDAPLLLGILYARKYTSYLPKSYELFVSDLHHMFLQPSLNVMIERKYDYDVNGRNQTESEAKALDGDLIGILDEHDVEYAFVMGDDLENFVENKVRLPKENENV